MHLTTRVKQIFPALNVAGPLYRVSCAHNLASFAHAEAMAHSSVLNPYWSYDVGRPRLYAEKPAAPYVKGLRITPMAAQAAWGASCAVSLVRTDLPKIYGLAFIKTSTTFVDAFALGLPAASAIHLNRPLASAAANQRLLGGMARIAAALSLPITVPTFEMLIGSGESTENAILKLRRAKGIAEHDTARGKIHVAQEVGALGAVEHWLLQRATTAPLIVEVVLVGCAVGLRLLLNPVRLVGSACICSVALCGASIGLCWEVGARSVFVAYYALNKILRRPVMVRALGDFYDDHHQILHDGDIAAAMNFQVDEAEHAEVIAEHRGPRPAVRLRRGRGAMQADGHIAMMPGRHVAAPLPQLWDQVAAEAVREVRAAGAGNLRAGIDVHASGRDPATRRSIFQLLKLYPRVSESAQIAQLEAYIARHVANRTRLATTRHVNNRTICDAALQTLGLSGRVEEGSFRNVLSEDPSHNITLDDGRRISLKKVCATVWYAINNLKASAFASHATNQKLREERKDAFILALADCMNSFNVRMCGAGQAQRMVLVLQGCLEGIVVDPVIRPPSVADFINLKARNLQRDLGENASEQEIKRRFDEALLEGMQLLERAQHRELAEQLVSLANLSYDTVWSPTA